MAKTVSMDLPHPSQADDRSLRAELPLKVLAAYAVAAIAAILLVSLPFATDYVGADNDDIMRLVVVRDLLAGQSWFDPTQYRLGLEGGTLMHWSRLVDLPIANLIDIFSVFAGRERAEALALAIWPLALTVPLLYGMGLAGLRLGGRPTMHVALLLSAIFVVSINRFQPGSIDHHNVQLALIAIVAAMLLDGRFRARSFAVAGAGCALAIAIGAETTPLVAVVCLLVAFKWAWHGEPFLRAASAFGLALALVTTLAFFGTIAPAHYRQVTCDNLSYGFYALATFGGGALFLVATQASRLERNGRFVALLVAGAVIAAATLAIAPGCLQNPLNELDPLLKTFWLSG
ncbi:hypothetical protein [Sinorhizobium sp. BG8]|uniref:hypothetical protein n=1 Tax=Sinorhizobium sp. BG8 TaxID=2613773 RepID=UPI001FEEB66E|nr:hypothetical protein [Sinorhizobium sp. BG8]